MPEVSFAGATMAGVWIAALAMVGILIRQIVPYRKQEHDAEALFRDALIARVERLENKLERQERRHVAEQSLGNHQFRNIAACFDAMLMMLELSPDRAPEIIVQIKAMRAKQIMAEAREKAIIRAADLSVDNAEAAEDAEAASAAAK